MHSRHTISSPSPEAPVERTKKTARHSIQTGVVLVLLLVAPVVSAAADAETPKRLGATKAMAPSGSIRRTSWFNILVQPLAPGADASMLEREEPVWFVDAT